MHRAVKPAVAFFASLALLAGAFAAGRAAERRSLVGALLAQQKLAFDPSDFDPLAASLPWFTVVVVFGADSAAAAVAVFAPPFLIVLLAAPYYRRFAGNPQVKAFVQGVTAAAVGAIAGAAVILGKRSLVDIPTLMIGLITFGVLVKLRKVPEPVLILIAGVIGLLLHHGNP